MNLIHVVFFDIMEILHLSNLFYIISHLLMGFRMQKNPHVILFVINFPSDEGHSPNEWTFSDLMFINYLTVRVPSVISI